MVLYIYCTWRRSIRITGAKDLIEQVTISRQRSGDEICARCYFYYARTAELTGKAGAIRGDLFAGLRTATLRKDEPGQAVLLNGLLRNFIDHNLIDQVSLASAWVYDVLLFQC